MKILHIAEPQTFTKPFFELIQREVDPAQHFILSHTRVGEWPRGLNIKKYSATGVSWVLAFFRHANSAEKIILHGLWDFYVIVLLFFQPWLLKKCYWMIWGGDLYDYMSNCRGWKWWLRNLFKRPVIRSIGNLVTYLEGDVELARKWYGATGKHHDCVMYTSNVYRNYGVKTKPHSGINIQIGNSADSSNNHLEILEMLAPFCGEDIAIYAPLSYGNEEYARSVIRAGKEKFGDKFKPLTEFMPVDQYLEFLGRVDIAIFNHRRQQAMGNIITLLGLGKKVYMRSDITPWSMFKKIGVKVYDISGLELVAMDDYFAKSNSAMIESVFSKEKMVHQLKKIFEG
ncbi:TDP-N-acetylfucosamine:lipid II N-acetylfucosaminyltransferase [Pseudomonas sp. G34]|uniref:TDP-N-acetylfucosamine:lipid II N-acetylfucosaminyltransferase n=1 Tax=Pseudomonas sp. G34 TaxID=3059083 RepID=UPI00280874FC|nr:TDP-N-acetylfucosamine:lipid II N-acetylfucosaminyltransferase [Pseudomonas sp. G34]MDQ7985757.1 TDP-N-acetylfucosamine:lipid II N-acetylfucosaminyltransferase [Pseudomonas sp. G34]